MNILALLGMAMVATHDRKIKRHRKYLIRLHLNNGSDQSRRSVESFGLGSRRVICLNSSDEKMKLRDMIRRQAEAEENGATSIASSCGAEMENKDEASIRRSDSRWWRCVKRWETSKLVTIISKATGV